nr:type II toxin-antitoxin system PemK/MazF family toxin [Maliibacterium massiliense]
MIRRGDMFFADLSPVVGSEQGGLRPVVVVQNDMGNKYSPTVIVATITSRMEKANLPTHVALASKDSGLPKPSVVLTEQIRTLDKRRLRRKTGTLPRDVMNRIDRALSISLGFDPTDT